MNPQLNVKDFQTRVGSDTEEVFNDEFWESLNFVVNAVDNVKARLYVDSKCVWYNKPLLESGTLGTKANSQMIVPHKTQCYGDSQDPPEESIPMCTLRNFPNQIEHCIEWGRDMFNKMFTDSPSNTSAYLTNSGEFMSQLIQNNTVTAQKNAMEEIKKLIDLKKTADFNRCIDLAREHFEINFNHSIRNLLNMFPHDAKDKDGQAFWSGPKRAPSPLTYDPKNPNHAMFISACANLIAFNLGIP